MESDREGWEGCVNRQIGGILGGGSIVRELGDSLRADWGILRGNGRVMNDDSSRKKGGYLKHINSVALL